MDIMLGMGQGAVVLKYVGPGMKVEDMQLAEFIDKVFWDVFDRLAANPAIILFPSMFLKQITEADRRFFTNCATMRGYIMEQVKKAQANPNPEADFNVVSMLAHDPLYSKNPEDIVDDVIVMFIAGQKTVQTTITNLITHMLHNPDLKEKFDAEVNPFLDKCKDDFMELMNSELIEELEYLRMCYYEVLRCDTPIPQSSTSCFNRDVTIDGIHFKKGTAIYLAMNEMHRVEKEWIEPDTFIPERFDMNSKYYKRPDGSNRNPLAFNPFLGGKRICLGKTFAETTLKLVIPLYYHHFDFEFMNEEQKKTRPHYEIGGHSMIPIPMRFTTKNKVKQNFRTAEATKSEATANYGSI